MNEIAKALSEAARQLEAVSDTPRLDAELLMAHALGLDRGAMLLRMRDLHLPPRFAALIERRLQHEPVAYIRGVQEFWDLTLQVTSATLIPRADSETLIEASISAFGDRTPPSHVLDLGTGSGALLLAALSAFVAAQGVAIDASEAALAVAKVNADRLGFGNRAAFHHRSWYDRGWREDLGQFDLILCNPPYVETGADLAPQVRDHEPASALFAGADGFDDYKCLIPQVPSLLKPGGLAIFEIGKGQDVKVSQMANDAGMPVAQHRDLAGIIRALSFSKPVGR